MRILAITHQYPTPGQPTFALYNRQQFARLARLHELRIVRPVPWSIAARDAFRARRTSHVYTSEDGIEVHAPVFYFPPRMLGHQYGSFFERSVAADTGRLLASYRPDLLLSCWAHPDGWATVQLARRAGLPVAVKVLGSDVLVLARGRRRDRIAEALAGADGVIAVSQDLVDHVRQLGVPAERVHLVAEGIDRDRFCPGDRRASRERLGLPLDGRLILFVGSLLASKGALDLIAACATLCDRGIAFQCRLVGHGRDAAKVAQMVRANRLDDRVVLTGMRPNAELADWYRASDVVALPSYSEGIPNVLREALSCGTPFVATRAGGIPEIAGPSFGRLVTPGDVVDLTDALAAMLESPARVDKGVSERVSISWEESARLLARHLETIVETRTPAARASTTGA